MKFTRTSKVLPLTILWQQLVVASCFLDSSTGAFNVKRIATSTCLSPSALAVSLKPAAIPLMDSGKALARTGELIVDVTTNLDLYGGALSSAAADIRNAGDSLAQAAASSRFKTGTELVIDELRECGTCMLAAAEKIQRAVKEAQQDEMFELANTLESMVGPLTACGESLEGAGVTVLQRQSAQQTGEKFVLTAEFFELLSCTIPNLSGVSEASLAGQRMAYAAEKIREAGQELQGGAPPKSTGKSWLKGGR